MPQLSCKTMGVSGCDFTAHGETDEEVVSNLISHAREAHADIVSEKDDETLSGEMMPNISE